MVLEEVMKIGILVPPVEGQKIWRVERAEDVLDEAGESGR
jgi:hypothetical protein